ncbi:hypothetical protein ACTQ9E_004224 [Vibrio vulnificus]
MKKSVKEAWKYFERDSKSIWNVLWAIVNFIWLSYITLQVNGAEKTAELIASKLFFGLLPFILSSIALFLYHYLRSDLYIEQSKPQIGKTLIPGKLLKMVEHWTAEPIVALTNRNVEYTAYRKLLQYRSSYEFEHIHSKIDEFTSAFEVSSNLFTDEIKTKFVSKNEAEKAFPRLKVLAKEIGRKIT